MDSFAAIVSGIVQRRAALLEEICEAAVQSGTLGVLVIDPTLEPVVIIDEINSGYSATGQYSVELSALVPYGHVFHFPSRAAVDRWIENGCPR